MRQYKQSPERLKTASALGSVIARPALEGAMVSSLRIPVGLEICPYYSGFILDEFRSRTDGRS